MKGQAGGWNEEKRQTNARLEVTEVAKWRRAIPSSGRLSSHQHMPLKKPHSPKKVNLIIN